MLETSFGQIPEQSKRTLAHFWHFVLSSGRKQPTVSNISLLVTVSEKTLGSALHLHALVQKSEDVAASHQLLDGASQTFSQSTQKIQSHNHEVFVWGLMLVWLGLMKLNKWKKYINNFTVFDSEKTLKQLLK